MSRDIVLPGGDKLQLFDSHYTSQQVEDILTKALRQPGTNLLDNWYFVGGGSQQGGGQFPINQRGQTEYTGNVYTIDRFILVPRTHTCAVTLQADGVKVACTSYVGANNGYFFHQRVERLLPGTYTFSVLAHDISGSQFMTVQNTGFTAAIIPLQLGLTSVTFTISTATEINAIPVLGRGTIGQAVIEAVKLELGPGSTLAHQDANGNWVLNDPPPNFALELEKCQRYQIPFRYANSDLRVRASVLNGTDYLFFMVPVPTSLRGRPTIENADDLAVTTIKNEFQSGFIFNVQGYGPGYVMIIAYKQNHGLNDGCLLSWKSPNPPLFNSNL